MLAIKAYLSLLPRHEQLPLTCRCTDRLNIEDIGECVAQRWTRHIIFTSESTLYYPLHQCVARTRRFSAPNFLVGVVRLSTWGSRGSAYQRVGWGPFSTCLLSCCCSLCLSPSQLPRACTYHCYHTLPLFYPSARVCRTEHTYVADETNDMYT